MPIEIGQVTSDIQIEGTPAQATAPERGPLPEGAELLRWQLLAENAERASRRLACGDEDD